MNPSPAQPRDAADHFAADFAHCSAAADRDGYADRKGGKPKETHVPFTQKAVTPDGPMEWRRVETAIVWQQPDGTWRPALDDPFGPG